MKESWKHIHDEKPISKNDNVPITIELPDHVTTKKKETFFRRKYVKIVLLIQLVTAIAFVFLSYNAWLIKQRKELNQQENKNISVQVFLEYTDNQNDSSWNNNRFLSHNYLRLLPNSEGSIDAENGSEDESDINSVLKSMSVSKSNNTDEDFGSGNHFLRRFVRAASDNPKKSDKQPAKPSTTDMKFYVPCEEANVSEEKCRDYGVVFVKSNRGVMRPSNNFMLMSNPKSKRYLRCEQVFDRGVKELDEKMAENYLKCKDAGAVSPMMQKFIERKFPEEIENAKNNTETTTENSSDNTTLNPTSAQTTTENSTNTTPSDSTGSTPNFSDKTTNQDSSTNPTTVTDATTYSTVDTTKADMTSSTTPKPSDETTSKESTTTPTDKGTTLSTTTNDDATQESTSNASDTTSAATSSITDTTNPESTVNPSDKTDTTTPATGKTTNQDSTTSMTDNSGDTTISSIETTNADVTSTSPDKTSLPDETTNQDSITTSTGNTDETTPSSPQTSSSNLSSTTQTDTTIPPSGTTTQESTSSPPAKSSEPTTPSTDTTNTDAISTSPSNNTDTTQAPDDNSTKQETTTKPTDDSKTTSSSTEITTTDSTGTSPSDNTDSTPPSSDTTPNQDSTTNPTDTASETTSSSTETTASNDKSTNQDSTTTSTDNTQTTPSNTETTKMDSTNTSPPSSTDTTTSSSDKTTNQDSTISPTDNPQTTPSNTETTILDSTSTSKTDATPSSSDKTTNQESTVTTVDDTEVPPSAETTTANTNPTDSTLTTVTSNVETTSQGLTSTTAKQDVTTKPTSDATTRLETTTVSDEKTTIPINFGNRNKVDETTASPTTVTTPKSSDSPKNTTPKTTTESRNNEVDDLPVNPKAFANCSNIQNPSETSRPNCFKYGVSMDELEKGVTVPPDDDPFRFGDVILFLSCEDIFNDDLEYLNTGLFNDYIQCNEAEAISPRLRDLIESRFKKIFDIFSNAKKPEKPVDPNSFVNCKDAEVPLSSKCRDHGLTVDQMDRGIKKIDCKRWHIQESPDKLYLECQDVFNTKLKRLPDELKATYEKCKQANMIDDETKKHIEGLVPTEEPEETTEFDVGVAIDPRSYVNCKKFENVTRPDDPVPDKSEVFKEYKEKCIKEGVTIDDLQNGIGTKENKNEAEVFPLELLYISCQEVFTSFFPKFTKDLLEDYERCKKIGALSPSSVSDVEVFFQRPFEIMRDVLPTEIDLRAFVKCKDLFPQMHEGYKTYPSRMALDVCSQMGGTVDLLERSGADYGFTSWWFIPYDMNDVYVDCKSVFNLNMAHLTPDLANAYQQCKEVEAVSPYWEDFLNQEFANPLRYFGSGKTQTTTVSPRSERMALNPQQFISCQTFIPFFTPDGFIQAPSFASLEKCSEYGVTQNELKKGIAQNTDRGWIMNEDVNGLYISCNEVFSDTEISETQDLKMDFQRCLDTNAFSVDLMSTFVNTFSVPNIEYPSITFEIDNDMFEKLQQKMQEITILLK